LRKFSNSTLLGLLTASERIREEYGLDLNSPEAIANFADKYNTNQAALNCCGQPRQPRGGNVT